MAYVCSGPEIPAVNYVIEPTPESDLLEGNRSYIRLVFKKHQNAFDILSSVELVDVNLPEVIACCAVCVSSALLILFTGPKPVTIALFFGGDYDELVLRIFGLLKISQNLEGPIH